jgi:hypothetical protein
LCRDVRTYVYNFTVFTYPIHFCLRALLYVIGHQKGEFLSHRVRVGPTGNLLPPRPGGALALLELLVVFDREARGRKQYYKIGEYWYASES